VHFFIGQDVPGFVGNAQIANALRQRVHTYVDEHAIGRELALLARFDVFQENGLVLCRRREFP
jgi:hypothetical protein